jgi:hypothetical protein
LATVSDHFKENGLSWENLADICTDSAPVILGCYFEFMTKAITGTYCAIQRQALATKLCNLLTLTIKTVNSVKISALNIRLFAALCAELGADHNTLLFHMEVY